MFVLIVFQLIPDEAILVKLPEKIYKEHQERIDPAAGKFLNADEDAELVCFMDSAVCGGYGPNDPWRDYSEIFKPYIVIDSVVEGPFSKVITMGIYV